MGISFIGCTVDVVYDPAGISELTIEYEGYPYFKAHELVIGERAGKRPKLPDHLQIQPAESSRLLTAAEKRNIKREENQVNAVSYRRVIKAGEKDV